MEWPAHLPLVGGGGVSCRVTCCVDYIQVLEDMLRACVLDHKGNWEEHLP